MKVTSLGFRTDLMLRGMAGSVITGTASYVVVRTPENPGFWWGNFLLFGAPPGKGDVSRWSALFAEEFPGAAHLALGVDGADGRVGDTCELDGLGVTVEVNAVLTATRLVPPADRPGPGTRIRPLTGDEDWAQAAELHFACHDLGESAEQREFAERQLAGQRGLCEAGHGAWFGAFVGGRMRSRAGLFSDGGGLARFQNVETHPDFRRRGLASSLVHHAGRWGLTELGARTLVIVADPGYHAIRVYRALGFTGTERQVGLYRAPVPG